MNVKLLHNQHVRDHLNFQRGLLVLVFFLLTAFGAQAQETTTTVVYGTDPALTYSTLPTVTSDKDDYSPGMTAIITGSGWTKDQFVDIHLEEEPAHDHHHGYHDTKVDENGNWRIEYPIEDRHFGVKFTVVVEGVQTGAKAYTTFTDAVSITGISPSSGTAGTDVTITGSGLFLNNWTTKVTFGSAVATEKVASRETLANGNQKIVVTAPNQSSTTGSYRVVVEVRNSQGNNPQTSPENLSFTYGKLSQTISFDALAGKNYGDASITLSATASSGLAVSYTSSNTAVATINGNTVTIVGTGTTSITATQSGNVSYDAATNVSRTLTVTARPITIAAAAKNKTYGEADPALTYAITSGSLVTGDAFTGSLTRDAGNDVGAYAIKQGSVALSSNYALSYVGADLTIGTRAVTITAAAKNKTYGEADPALTYAITSGSLVTGDAFTGSLTRDAGNDVGAYAIKQGSVALSSNYALSYVGADLTIGTRAVTITAAAKNKTYGEADPALTYAITSGSLVTGDAFTGSLTRDAGNDVGAYAIKQGSVALSSNYALSYVGADLTIGTRAVTITAAAKNKTYGEADPALTYAITSGSLVTGDAFTGSLTRDAGNDVGAYAIKQGSVALSSNYALSYVGADLTIGTRAVTITADAQVKIAGSSDPVLTYKITTGTLVSSDAFSGSLARVAGEAKGVYPINQGTVALSSNYNLTYVGAVLEIFNAAAVSLTGSGPVEINTNSTITATFTGDVIEPVWNYGTTTLVSQTNTQLVLTSSAFAVQMVTLTYKDGTGKEFTTEPIYAVFFNPNAGFVTGGGWIVSPAGAYKPAGSTPEYVSPIGKATFGFVSKYEKGAKLPTGNTEFQYHLGGMNFKSTVYEWLTVAGSRAQYKGSGTINGMGDYGFLLTAVDGEVNGKANDDRFRIKIWDKTTNHIVYDNQRTATSDDDVLSTVISGGSIVIHQPNVKSTSGSKLVAASKPEFEQAATKFQNYPNPYNDRTTITFSSVKEESFALEVYDVKGALVRKVDMGVTEAGKTYSYEFESRNMPEGMYFARLITASGIQTIKMVLKR